MEWRGGEKTMKCDQAQDLMYLCRPGELFGEQRQELEEHMATCTACAAEMNAVREMEKRVSEVRNTEPRLKDPAHITGAILRAIDRSRQQPDILPRILPEWTTTPAFRIAACIALFLLCGSFFLQTAIDARKVATLEGRMMSLSTTSNAMEPQEIQRAGLFLSGTGWFTALPESLGIAATEITQWQKEPAMATMLATLFGRQDRYGTTMIDYLAKKHPRLASVRIDDGIDDREREILASDGEAFIKDIEMLIQKGGVLHDR
jgi:hypothetical protein